VLGRKKRKKERRVYLQEMLLELQAPKKRKWNSCWERRSSNTKKWNEEYYTGQRKTM